MRKLLETIGIGFCVASVWTTFGALMGIRNGTFLALFFLALFVISIFFLALCQVAGDADKRAGRDG